MGDEITESSTEKSFLENKKDEFDEKWFQENNAYQIKKCILKKQLFSVRK